MNYKYLLSIVIPFHDRYSPLVELLFSLPDDQRIEIILIDDHSSHPYPSFPSFYYSDFKIFRLDSYSSSRFAGAARNLGLRLSLGKYIMFLDSDDLFVESSWSYYSSLLSNYEFDAFFGFIGSFLDSDYKRTGSRHFRYNSLLSLYKITKNSDLLLNHLVIHGKLFLRDYLIANLITFDEIQFSNDILFAAKIILYSPRLYLSDLELIRIREGHTSMISTIDKTAIVVRINSLFCLNSLLKASGKSKMMLPAFPWLLKLLVVSPQQACMYAYKTIRLGFPLFLTRLSFGRSLIHFFLGFIK